jgi:hypothetical protein
VQKSVTTVQKSVTTVQKSVTTVQKSVTNWSYWWKDTACDDKINQSVSSSLV